MEPAHQIKLYVIGSKIFINLMRTNGPPYHSKWALGYRCAQIESMGPLAIKGVDSQEFVSGMGIIW